MQSINSFENMDHKSSIIFVGLANVGLGLGAPFGGLKPYVLEGKTLPNQGIRLCLKMALLMRLHSI